MIDEVQKINREIYIYNLGHKNGFRIHFIAAGVAISQALQLGESRAPIALVRVTIRPLAMANVPVNSLACRFPLDREQQQFPSKGFIQVWELAWRIMSDCLLPPGLFTLMEALVRCRSGLPLLLHLHYRGVLVFTILVDYNFVDGRSSKPSNKSHHAEVKTARAKVPERTMRGNHSCTSLRLSILLTVSTAGINCIPQSKKL